MATDNTFHSSCYAGLDCLPPPDAALLRLVLDDRLPLSTLLHWISLKSTEVDTTSGNKGSLQLEEPDEFGFCKMRLLATNQQSFAVSFLNYIRTQAQFSIANAQCLSKGAANGSFPQNGADMLEVQEKQAEILHGHQIEKKELLDSLKEQQHPTVVHGGCDTGQQSCRDPERYQPRAGDGGDFFKPQVKPSYENDFPALTTSPATVNLKGSSTSRKQSQMRRLTPTYMENPIVDSAFILADVQLNSVQEVPTTRRLRAGPIKVDMDVLMQRCGKVGKVRSKGKNDLSRMDKLLSGSHDKTEKSDKLTEGSNAAACLTPNSPECEIHSKLPKKRCAMNVEAFHKATATLNDLPLLHDPTLITRSLDSMGKSKEHCTGNRKQPISDRLHRLALVHSKLLVLKMVPSLLGELLLLFQLLNWDAVLVAKKPSETGIQAQDQIFFSSDDGACYACAVLEHAGTILDSVGEPLISALLEVPAISNYSSSLRSRLRSSLTDYQASALRSCKGYDAAIRANRALQLSSEKYSIPSSRISGMPSMLPFQEARDSRKNFRTKEEQRVFNNRELCRDRFYMIMRSALGTHNPFTCSATTHESFRKYMESVRQFLTVLLFENYSWFSELFMEQVLQTSSWGETDPEVTGLVRQGPGKLQRLHDRMIGCSSSQLSTPQQLSSLWNSSFELPLSPSSPWSQVRKFQSATNNDSVSNQKTREPGSVFTRKYSDSDSLWSHFSRYFCQSLRPYIWFLEAADSYRLNMHLIWSIVAKISSLEKFPSRSHAAADILIGFTDHVLILKALAGLLGFLTFSPGAAMLHLKSNLVAEESSKLSHMSRTAPSVNVVDILWRSMLHGSVLLNLPWVLEFLRFAKTDKESQSQTYFQDALMTLRQAYLLPMLNPLSPDFGVGSICILAALDGFFDYMDLPCCDSTGLSPGPGDSVKDVHIMNKKGADVLKSRDLENVAAVNALDRISGIVDTRYIQHCCPLLMDLRSILVEANKKRQQQHNFSGSPEVPLRRFSRKITPVQRLSHPQPSPRAGILEEQTTLEHTIISKQDHLKSSLQRKFLEQRPQVRRLVDFVVDMIASNAASSATSKFLTPILELAYSKLDNALSDEFSKLNGTCPGVMKQENARAPHYEAIAEHVISDSLHQVLPPAMEYAKGHTAAKTFEALASLLNPDESSYIWGVAAGIAVEEADSAACRKVLASISSNIRKHVFNKLENWQKEHSTGSRDKTCIYSFTNKKILDQFEQQQQQLAVSDCPLTSSTEKVDETVFSIPKADSSDCLIGAEPWNQSEALKSTNPAVKRQLAFAADDTLPSLQSPCLLEQHDFTVERRQKLLADVIICNCASTSRYCSKEVIQSGERYLLRHHLATVCMSMESLLFQFGEILPGGSDATVLQQKMNFHSKTPDFNHLRDGISMLYQKQSLGLLSRDEKRIELGLLKRIARFAVYLCLLSPFIAFGFEADMQSLVSKCSCNFMVPLEKGTHGQPHPAVGLTSSERNLTTGYKRKDNSRPACNSYNGSSVPNNFHAVPYKTLSRTKHENEGSSCKISNWLGGIMQAVVCMWRAMTKSKLCAMDFLMLEFLAPWHWWWALNYQTLETPESCFILVKHGIAGTILQMLEEVSCLKDMEAAVETFLHSMRNDNLLSTEEQNGCLIQFSGGRASEFQKTRKRAKALAKAISNQLLKW